jgi:hypothetical protein
MPGLNKMNAIESRKGTIEAILNADTVALLHPARVGRRNKKTKTDTNIAVQARNAEAHRRDRGTGGRHRNSKYAIPYDPSRKATMRARV